MYFSVIVKPVLLGTKTWIELHLLARHRKPPVTTSRHTSELLISFSPVTTGGTPVESFSKILKRILKIQITRSSMLASKILLVIIFQLKCVTFLVLINYWPFQRVALMTRLVLRTLFGTAFPEAA